MNRKQQYNRDTKIEQITAQFLDNYFYPVFESKATVIRYLDAYHQFGGIDVSINETNFDEKVKVYGYLNKVQEYIGFECSLKIKNGQIQDGWFLNDNLSTDYYSVIGLSAEVNDVKNLTDVSSITAADVLWIKKSDVFDLLDTHDISFETLKTDTKEIRDRGNNNKTDIFGHTALDRTGKCRTQYPKIPCCLTYSTKMFEQPVNLVFERKTLESLPHTTHFVVTRNKVSKQ